MSANGNVEYYWTDAKGKVVKTSAPSYVDSATTQIQSWINDEAVFPTRQGMTWCRNTKTVLGGAFPSNFVLQYVKPIFRHLYRILAHIYHAHYPIIVACTAEAHLNTLFAHFTCFATTFDLLEKKEMQNMDELILDVGRTSVSWDWKRNDIYCAEAKTWRASLISSIDSTRLSFACMMVRRDFEDTYDKVGYEQIQVATCPGQLRFDFWNNVLCLLQHFNLFWD